MQWVSWACFRPKLLGLYRDRCGEYAENCIPLIHTKPNSQNNLLRPPNKEEWLSGSPSLGIRFLYIELVSVQTGCCVLSEKHGKHKNYEIDPPKWSVLPSSYEKLQEKLGKVSAPLRRIAKYNCLLKGYNHSSSQNTLKGTIRRWIHGQPDKCQ